MSRDPLYVRHILAPRYDFDRRVVTPYLRDILIAHILMLRRQRIVDDSVAAATVKTLLKLNGTTPPTYIPDWEDIYFAVEAWVEQDTHGLGEFRLALSRNDVWATVARMVARDQILSLQEALVDLRGTFLEVAECHKDTITIAQTHHQHAQLNTIGHYMLAVEAMLSRCTARYADCLARLNWSPLGAVALATTGFPIDRRYTADLLGFPGILENSYDAVSAGDHIGEIAGCHGVLTTSLSRVIHDLLFWTTNEVDALRVAPGFVQISSIMPQKRNPVVLEHIRSGFSRILGACAGIWASAHNVPFGDVNDPVDDAIPLLVAVTEELKDLLHLLGRVVRTSEFRPEAWNSALSKTFAPASELADVLVRTAGIPFRDAHAIVTRVVDGLHREGRPLQALTLEDIQAAAEAVVGRALPVDETAIRQAVDAREFVRRREVEGGPGPRAMAQALVRARANLERDATEIRAIREKLTKARELLYALAQEVPGG